MNLIWQTLLRSNNLRQSLISYLKARHFSDLGHSIPLGNGYWAQLLENDSYDSFSEIFIEREYDEFVPSQSISKVLDIGANYGFFSLWLQATRPKQVIHALMVEPSLTCIPSLERLTTEPFLDGRFQFLSKAIGKKNLVHVDFFERSHMAGSCFASSEGETIQQVEVLKEEDIFQSLPPPYDLLKCDIEGSEWELIENYRNLLKSTKFLTLEWHSWHNGGGGFNQIKLNLKEIGFEITNFSRSKKATAKKGEVGTFLAKNLCFSF